MHNSPFHGVKQTGIDFFNIGVFSLSHSIKKEGYTAGKNLFF